MAAEITARRADSCSLELSIRGPIVEGDGERVAFELQSTVSMCRSGYSTKHVLLDSPGGSVQEALTMGRAMRRHRASVCVLEDAQCASSCVLVFVGGISRCAVKKLGVHRPYFEDARGLDSRDIETSWRQMDSAIRQYLQQMNVSSALAEMMTTTRPEAIIIGG